MPSTTRTRTNRANPRPGDAPGGEGAPYRLPIVGLDVPERVGNVAFWTGLAGVVALGVVDLPLAGLVGAGVVVARHGGRRNAAAT